MQVYLVGGAVRDEQLGIPHKERDWCVVGATPDELLGDGYRQAREAVCQESAFLLHRLAGLRNLAFSDGTPFADPETQRWLDSIEFNAGAAAPIPNCG